MDKHLPHHQDDLSDLEHRLSSWRPDDLGVNADAMLFAAGLAAGRSERGRLLGLGLGGLLAVLALGLGAWGWLERAERQALANCLRERTPSSATFVVVLPASPYTPSPGDYFSLRRQMEQDPSRWLASLQPTGPQTPGPPPPEPAILRAGQRDGPLFQ